MKRPKFEIVLHALNKGRTVEWDGYKYVLAQSSEGLPLFCIEAKRTCGDSEPEDVYLAADMTLNHFMKKCEAMSDDDVAIIGFEVALQGMKEGGQI